MNLFVLGSRHGYLLIPPPPPPSAQQNKLTDKETAQKQKQKQEQTVLTSETKMLKLKGRNIAMTLDITLSAPASIPSSSIKKTTTKKRKKHFTMNFAIHPIPTDLFGLFGWSLNVLVNY